MVCIFKKKSSRDEIATFKSIVVFFAIFQGGGDDDGDDDDKEEEDFGTVPRCKPFKYAYEKEIVMYAHFKKLDYFSTECVYSPYAYRGHARWVDEENPTNIGTTRATPMDTPLVVVSDGIEIWVAVRVLFFFSPPLALSHH